MMTIPVGRVGPLAGVVNRLVDRRGDLRAIAVMRMLFGVIVVRHLWPALTAATTPVERFHVPWWSWLPEPSAAGYRALTLAGVLAGAAMTIGTALRHRRSGAIAARAGTIGALAVVSYLLFVDMTGFAHNRGFLVWMLLGLALLPADADRDAVLWPVTLAQIVVSSVYLTSGGTKLLNRDWRGGLVMWDRVNRHAYRIPFDGWISDVVTSRAFHNVLSPAAIALELFIGIALWGRRTRLVAIWVALAFHASIEVTADVQTFSYSTIAALLLWVTPRTGDRTLISAPAWLGVIVGRLDWLGRFRVVAAAEPGPTVLVDRDGTERSGRDATLTVLSRLPLLFPVSGPVLALERTRSDRRDRPLGDARLPRPASAYADR